jgi:hypothetical protein
MKPLRTHDYPELGRQAEFQPNGRALRGILAALVGSVVVCFGITLSRVLSPPPQPRAIRAIPNCTCQKAGACRGQADGRSEVRQDRYEHEANRRGQALPCRCF